MNRHSQFTARPADPAPADTKEAPVVHWERGETALAADEHRAGRVLDVIQHGGKAYLRVVWEDGRGLCVWPATAFRKQGELIRDLNPRKPADEVRKPDRFR